MKLFGALLLTAGILFATARGIFHTYVHYDYKNKIGSYWDLADRASTISQKSEYINKFVEALEAEKLYGVHNALFFPNDENSFSENMKALKSLQQRLITISSLDENSFAYQTAMQQITAQEQGEANQLTKNLRGCWEKENYYTAWNILFVIGFLLLQIIMVGLGFMLVTN